MLNLLKGVSSMYVENIRPVYPEINRTAQKIIDGLAKPIKLPDNLLQLLRELSPR